MNLRHGIETTNIIRIKAIDLLERLWCSDGFVSGPERLFAVLFLLSVPLLEVSTLVLFIDFFGTLCGRDILVDFESSRHRV